MYVQTNEQILQQCSATKSKATWDNSLTWHFRKLRKHQALLSGGPDTQQPTGSLVRTVEKHIDGH